MLFTFFSFSENVVGAYALPVEKASSSVSARSGNVELANLVTEGKSADFLKSINGGKIINYSSNPSNNISNYDTNKSKTGLKSSVESKTSSAFSSLTHVKPSNLASKSKQVLEPDAGNPIEILCGLKIKEQVSLYQCLKTEIKSDISKKGFYKTEIDLERAVTNYPVINTTCHSFAHYIGAGAYQELGSIPKAITERTSLCAWGYMHGLYVAASAKLKGQELFDQMYKGCITIAKLKGNPYECAHGMGDGFVQGNSSNIKVALSWCDKIPNTVWHQLCSEGAFNNLMDYHMLTDIFLHHEKANALERAALTGNPYILCLNVSNHIDRWGCLDYSSHLRNAYNGNLQIIINACNQLSGDDNAGCYKGLGREWAFSFNSVSNKAGFSNCKEAKNDLGVAQCEIAFIFSRTQVTLDSHGKIYHSLCDNKGILTKGEIEGCDQVGVMLKDYFHGLWTI